MKMDEGRKINLDLDTFLSDRDTRTIDRGGGWSSRIKPRINASRRGELTLVGDGGSVLLKSHSLPVVARRHRVSTVIEKGDATTGLGVVAAAATTVHVCRHVAYVTERTWIVCKLRSRTRGGWW